MKRILYISILALVTVNGSALTAATTPPRLISGVTITNPPRSGVVKVSYTTFTAGITTFQFKTNGVPLPHGGIVRTVSGSINQRLTVGGRYHFKWHAWQDLPHSRLDALSVEVTLWQADTPPPILAVDLQGEKPTQRWYGGEIELPYAVAHDHWRGNAMLLRLIPATVGPWAPLGSPHYEVGRGSAEAMRFVDFPHPYYLAIFEVTQRQWESVMGTSTPAYWNSPVWYAGRPVERVSYDEIRGATTANIDWPETAQVVSASSFMGRLRALHGGLWGFDLPTEAQWEYACRAGTAGAWHNGTTVEVAGNDANLNLLGRNSFNGGQFIVGSSKLNPDHPNALGSVVAVTTDHATARAGSYLPNAWGIHDMHGNVWEWCRDWYVDGTTTSSTRVRRGGGWANGCLSCRSARRDALSPDTKNSETGFRVVLSLPHF